MAKTTKLHTLLRSTQSDTAHKKGENSVHHLLNQGQDLKVSGMETSQSSDPLCDACVTQRGHHPWFQTCRPEHLFWQATTSTHGGGAEVFIVPHLIYLSTEIKTLLNTGLTDIKGGERNNETDKQRETVTQAETETETERKKERKRERERGRGGERETEREGGGERERKRERERLQNKKSEKEEKMTARYSQSKIPETSQ